LTSKPRFSSAFAASITCAAGRKRANARGQVMISTAMAIVERLVPTRPHQSSSRQVAGDQ
jgi:hypothetical protein